MTRMRRLSKDEGRRMKKDSKTAESFSSLDKTIREIRGQNYLPATTRQTAFKASNPVMR